MAKLGLPLAEYSLEVREAVLGGSVFVPRPLGYGDYQTVVGEGSPRPRFGFRRVFAAGWSVGKVGSRDPFEPSSLSVEELFFFVFPRKPASSKYALGEVDREIYHAWAEKCASPEFSKPLGELVLSASAKWLGGDPMSSRLTAWSGGDKDGYPFVTGVLRVSDFRSRTREFHFAAAVTMIGKTWAVASSVSKADLGSSSAEKTAMDMAKAIYYLNKDFRVDGKTRKDSSGPFGWKMVD